MVYKNYFITITCYYRPSVASSFLKVHFSSRASPYLKSKLLKIEAFFLSNDFQMKEKKYKNPYLVILEAMKYKGILQF